ncbi:MAG: M20/M25/M40 family metallo-hydrolase [Chloroflexi bacterium]|nr:M20/M25/M40 family metallo-hydrolase [Chloroflexota bacterium]
MINRDRIVKTFTDIVQIDSVSGEEDEITRHLIPRLESYGLTVKLDSYGNIIADSKGDGVPLLISVHMDTVEPGRGIKPIIDGDRIRSDGTTIIGGDAKAGLAAILEALESITEDNTPHIPFQLAITKEEETGLQGAHNLDLSMIRAKDAVVFDGEGPVNTITIASPTYIGFDIEITGRAAHAGVEPEKGLSAIRVAAEMITRLPQGRLDEGTTFNVGLIEGGYVRNTVPEVTKVVGEFRSQSLETIDSVRLQVKGVLDDVRKMFPEAKIEDHMHTQFEHYDIPQDDPMLKRIVTTLDSLGLKPHMRPSGGGTDGNVFRLNDIKSVVVGMADTGMHTVRENVSIPGLVDAAHFCEALIRKG